MDFGYDSQKKLSDAAVADIVNFSKCASTPHAPEGACSETKFYYALYTPSYSVGTGG